MPPPRKTTFCVGHSEIIDQEKVKLWAVHLEGSTYDDPLGIKVERLHNFFYADVIKNQFIVCHMPNGKWRLMYKF